MARPSKYPPEVRARALATLTANGGNVKRTARELDLPEQTVRDWKSQQGRGQVPAVVEAALPAALDEFVEDAKNIRSKALRLIGDKIDSGDAKVGELNAVVGTLTDKIRLINGESTSRPESVNAGPSPQEFGSILAGFLQAAFVAQEKRAEEIVDAEFEEQPDEPGLLNPLTD